MITNNSIAKVFFAVIITTSAALNLSSCKKASTVTTASSTITEADAAELTTDAVSPSNGGMVTQLNSSVTIYKKVALQCGVKKDSSIVYISTAGDSPSYSYALNWNYVLSCNGTSPSLLTFNFTGKANYDGPRMSANDNSTGGFILTGFGASSTQYLLSTNYARSGTYTSKIGKQYTFTSNLAVTSTNVAVDKTSQEIVSGTATVTLTATSTSGKSFAFNGTLTFLGGKKATLVLNSGATYTIQWK
ncbi:MAG: hypothetical protein JWP45_188 [Mucilaginibacter sp.]|nr:hypothetical protein [Mucilaginibacter sp.]